MGVVEKVLRRVRRTVIALLIKQDKHWYVYPSYWHSLLVKSDEKETDFYFAARPNPGAGIGHQMANWIAGLWFSKKFGMKFAHIPFSDPQWERFLGFGEGERTIPDLRRQGYKVRRIPLFDENSDTQIERIQKIIDSYTGKKVIFLAEQDQFYRDQYGVRTEIQEKFYNAPVRKLDHLIYSADECNIAMHIRRGDIIQKPGEDNPNLTMRYQDNQYYVNALQEALKYVAPSRKNARIYLFSQSGPEEFPEFAGMNNVHFCNEMGAMDSFLHMVYADILITSKSSFSYKPALLNNGIKICPENFWHGYPNEESWYLLDEDGRKTV